MGRFWATAGVKPIEAEMAKVKPAKARIRFMVGGGVRVHIREVTAKKNGPSPPNDNPSVAICGGRFGDGKMLPGRDLARSDAADPARVQAIVGPWAFRLRPNRPTGDR